MKIERYTPPMSPLIRLTFTEDEGWAVLMALKDAVDKYREAAKREQWKAWAHELEELLRAD